MPNDDSSTSAKELPAEAAELLAAHPDIKWVDTIYADLSGVVRGMKMVAATPSLRAASATPCA